MVSNSVNTRSLEEAHLDCGGGLAAREGRRDSSDMKGKLQFQSLIRGPYNMTNPAFQMKRGNKKLFK